MLSKVKCGKGQVCQRWGREGEVPSNNCTSSTSIIKVPTVQSSDKEALQEVQKENSV